jgi:hypothetical protein
MSNILKKRKGIKRRVQAAVDQKNTPVTDMNLLACGFKVNEAGTISNIADLKIWKIGVLYYYKSDRNELIEIKEMFTVSQLVYGKKAYGW